LLNSSSYGRLLQTDVDYLVGDSFPALIPNEFYTVCFSDHGASSGTGLRVEG